MRTAIASSLASPGCSHDTCFRTLYLPDLFRALAFPESKNVSEVSGTNPFDCEPESSEIDPLRSGTTALVDICTESVLELALAKNIISTT
ncbi:MAG: hypothetical protein P8X88_01670, partial [Gammaproteobacteria bacterium]